MTCDKCDGEINLVGLEFLKELHPQGHREHWVNLVE